MITLKEKETASTYFPETYQYEIPGAGHLRITRKNTFSTGFASGFSIDVDWYTSKRKYGYYGGVLPDDEARKLAENILRVLNGEDE